MADQTIPSNPNERDNPWTPTGTEQTGKYKPNEYSSAGVWNSVPGQLLKFVNGAFARMAQDDLNKAIQQCLRELEQLQHDAPTRGLVLKASYADVQVGEAKQVYLLTLSYGYADGPIVGIWENADNPMVKGTSRAAKASGGAESKFNYGATRIRNETYLIPPMAGAGQKPEPSWMHFYRVVGSKLSTGDVEGAIHALNGCNMYDMLRILHRFALEGQAFNTLSNAYEYVGGVGTLRLKAAFAAVRARLGGVNNWSGFSLSFSEFSQLAPFEQRDIEGFLGRSYADEGLEQEKRNLVGRWIVSVSGGWTWLYSFKADQTVTWLDQGNGRNGRGKWAFKEQWLETTWHPSKTYEHWGRPVGEASMNGTTVMEGIKYVITASRLDFS